VCACVHVCVSQNEDDGLAGPELWDEVNESEDDSSLCIADHAYLTVIETVTKINACGRLKRLTEESKHAPSLQKRFPLYRTRLGFGLHMGWAIEGTIGSRVKVDCSVTQRHPPATFSLPASLGLALLPMLLPAASRSSLPLRA
jgi:hypothetical protein